MVNDSVFVIHKDGQRLENKPYTKVKIAYLKKGSANGVVTGLVNDYVSYTLNISSYREREKFDKAYAEEKARYEVVEYVPKKVE